MDTAPYLLIALPIVFLLVVYSIILFLLPFYVLKIKRTLDASLLVQQQTLLKTQELLSRTEAIDGRIYELQQK